MSEEVVATRCHGCLELGVWMERGLSLQRRAATAIVQGKLREEQSFWNSLQTPEVGEEGDSLGGIGSLNPSFPPRVLPLVSE